MPRLKPSEPPIRLWRGGVLSEIWLDSAAATPAPANPTIWDGIVPDPVLPTSQSSADTGTRAGRMVSRRPPRR